MRGRHALAVAALLALGAPALPAQEAQPASPAQRFVPVFGLTVSTLDIDADAAARSQVGARSYGLQLDAGVLMKRYLYLGMDLGGQFLKDHAAFTENTTGGEKKSTASVTYLSAVAGLRTGSAPGVPVALALNVGYSGAMTRRSIDQCVDCTVDELDIPGGGFVEPVLMFGSRRARLRVSDRVYFAGDGMRSVIAVGLDYVAWKR